MTLVDSVCQREGNQTGPTLSILRDLSVLIVLPSRQVRMMSY